MAGPVPSYLTTQTATQTAFTVPFGLLSFVNAAIATATAAGEFNVTVDCSLFVTEDVSNLRIYLDSLGYHVDFAKNTNDKSLNIDWGRFLDIPGTEVIVDQGTTPWIVAGTVTANQGTSPWVVTGTISTSPDVNVHDGAGNAISSTGTSLNVSVTDFPATVEVTQGTSPWTVDGTIIADQGTSPWITSVSNFPAIQAVSQSGVWTTGRTWTLLNTTDSVNVGNFPATQPISGTVTALQGTSPWIVAGTIIADQGTSPWVTSVSNFPAIQPVSQSGVWTTGRTWTLASGTDSVNVGNFPATQPISGTVTALQGTSPWVVSGSVTTSPNVNIHDSAGSTLSSTGTSLDVNITNFPATQAVTQSTSPWVVSGTVAATQSGAWTTGRTWALSSGTDSVASVQSGTWNINNISGTISLPTGAATEATLLAAKVDLDKFTFSSTRLLVDGSGVTQPVSGTITANQGTSPWVISGTVAATQSGSWTTGRTWTLASGTDSVAAVQSGTWTVQQGTPPWSVSQSGTWNINNISGTISLPTGAATAALQTQPGVDIGDVTVNNAAGASAVNIQDGGNSITVDGTVAATQSGTWTVQPGNTANTTPWLVENRAATLTTYSAAITNLTAAVTPTDIFTITGSNTKTVKIMYIEFTATETTSAIKDVVLIKRSSANTGGTSSAVTAVPNDSANAAATATVLAYTANPTLGTSVGSVRTRNVDFEATNLVGSSDQIIWTFGDRTQPITLRGTSEVLAINLNGVTSAGNAINIAIEWTEQ